MSNPSYVVEAREAVELANKIHLLMVKMQKRPEFYSVYPRELRYTLQHLRWAVVNARDEIRYMFGDLDDTLKADPNSDAEHTVL